MTYLPGQPVRVTRHIEGAPAIKGTVWIVDRDTGDGVRCWRRYDTFVGPEMIEDEEVAYIPSDALELITGGERDE